MIHTLSDDIHTDTHSDDAHRRTHAHTDTDTNRDRLQTVVGNLQLCEAHTLSDDTHTQ
jgi:hypothetical protein